MKLPVVVSPLAVTSLLAITSPLSVVSVPKSPAVSVVAMQISRVSIDRWIIQTGRLLIVRFQRGRPVNAAQRRCVFFVSILIADQTPNRLQSQRQQNTLQMNSN